jgi:catechol 2,3-dioxygenase-like lactoylglutathione lyase family enzyme
LEQEFIGMKLNHINLMVTDVQEASDFLVKYFGLRSMGGNRGMGFLTDVEEGWGFVLTLMKANKGTQGKYPAFISAFLSRAKSRWTKSTVV